jgi:hypothetical protein
MATEAQIAANRQNAQSATGPRTAEGKSRSSRNAVAFGIYSATDFVRPEEMRIYHHFCQNFQQDLSPEGALEQTLAAEITHAAWRLRRCSVAESSMTESSMNESSSSDPMLEPVTGATQAAIDRARAQAHNTLHRATAELRRLQTERQVRVECLPASFDTTHLGGLASIKDVLPALARDVQRKLLLHKLDGTDALNALINATNPPVAPPPEPAGPASPQPASPLTKQTQSAAAGIARNSSCPCHSGLKYKRCCGKNAPAVLRFAA